MRISLLLQREPFGSILEATLSRFWSERSGAESTVRWLPDADAPRPGEQVWFCNPYLNAIFVGAARAENFAPVSMEFARAPKLWKRPLQSAYVRAATSRAFSSHLAWKALAVMPPPERALHLLLLGGNNRIRILDREKGCSYVVLKDGFDDRYMERELHARQNHDDLLIPPLVEIADNRTWFAERYILGRPANRLSVRRTADRAVGEAAAALRGLQGRTSEEEDAASYAAELAGRSAELLSEASWMEPEPKEQLKKSTGDLLELVSAAAQAGQTVTRAFSHGDFQPANVLVADDKTWLIDWESADVRQLAYDPLVYALGSRSTLGLAARVLSALEASADEILDGWPGLNWQQRTARSMALALFLLEELVFYSEEASNPVFHGPGLELAGFAVEMSMAADGLKRASAA